jgi:hypothetical protein
MITVITLLRPESLQKWLAALSYLLRTTALIKEVVTVGGMLKPAIHFPGIEFAHLHVDRPFAKVQEQELINEYGRALYAGLKKAREDYVLILDDDVTPYKGAVDDLFKLIVDDVRGASGMYPPRGEENGMAIAPVTMSAEKNVPLWWSLVDKKTPGVMPIPGGWNGLMLMRRLDLLKISPMTSDIYGEETHFILAKVFSMLGWKFVATNEMLAHHGV